MSANEFSERIRLAVAAGDMSEVEKLLTSDWAVSWTQKRAKDVLDEIRDGGTLSPTRALHHALLIALTTANQLHVAQAQCNALRKRVEELEERVDSVTMNAMSYRGVFRDEHAPYRVGELVTHKGGLWHCWKATRDRPGTSDDWQLMSKNSRQEW